jgi:hypothetical protein
MAYTQKQTTNNTVRREFSKDVETTELIWHRDKKDRKITIIEGVGWMIQFDNAMPVELIKGTELFVPKMVYHRLWRGTTNLKIDIQESDGI